jgi:signal transduction histidine kinase/CheY-like chemotaxis protein
MRPKKLHSHLVSLALASAAAFGVCAAIALWLISSRLEFPLSDETALALGVCALGAIVLPALLALALARRLRLSIAALEPIARALVGNLPAALPAGLQVSELEQVSATLVHAANVARSREFALRSAERAKDEFLAILGHELRNPLAAMAAAAHVLRNAPGNGSRAQAAEIVARQVRHMTRLVDDLLDVTRITHGKVSLTRQALDLAACVDKALGELRLAGRLGRHDVQADMAEAWVRADEARIEQMVANLVGNAVKYTPPGGRIRVAVRRDGNQAILRVHDSGVGMSPELTARVFDLFVQGEGGARRSGGLGIGLTLVKHLAELHGGRAYAASSGPGQGSVFTIALPAIEARHDVDAALAVLPPPARHRILLVEDNPDTRNTLFAALELDGHRVFEAADGEAGIRTMSVVRPDVAIIDLGLPDVSGFEVATAVRQNPGGDRMVLIAITGYERPDTLRRAREAGFDEYVAKPIAPDRLERLIDAACAARARRLLH